MNLTIRKETQSDYRTVEELTREAFWNLHVPGCDEHYLVHTVRHHPDFIADLDFVAVLDGQIVGNIMYTKSHILNEWGGRIVKTITFGPVSVLPELQRRGIGSALIKHSRKAALEMGHKAIIIEGHPYNYCKHGFKSSRDFDIRDADGRFPFSLLVLELEEGVLRGHGGRYHGSEAYAVDAAAAQEFDRLFPKNEKKYRPTQEEFAIASRAYLE